MALFNSTGKEGRTTLTDYLGRMKEGQEAIYYITGEDLKALKSSPQLEGFAAKGIEVLLLADAVDSFWLSRITEFEGKSFKSVTRGSAELDKIKDIEEKNEETENAEDSEMDSLIALFKTALAGKVKDVKQSSRLTGSPVCLVADEGDMDIHLEKLLKAHKQFGVGESLRILELNAKHALIKKLAVSAKKNGTSAALEDAALLLLDQAHIVEGDPVADPVAFSKRMADFMAGSIPA
jgi:molecular chaperone HtpG